MHVHTAGPPWVQTTSTPPSLPTCLHLPAAFLRAVLAFMRPFISKKAARKIKVVQSLQEIAAATEGEVTLQSLGPAFNANLAAHEAAAAAAASATP